MKAIAGIVHFDTQPVASEILRRMMAHLHQADARAVHIWNKGPVALGTVTLEQAAAGVGWPPVAYAGAGDAIAGPFEADSLAAPKQAVASASLQDPALPDLYIVLDGRIDNRQELLQKLGPAAPLTSLTLTDEALVLACYAKWGDETPAYLIGDYAFAIWNERTHTLFCARDHFGLCPFYIYRGPRFFAFASDLAALLAHPEVPRRINDLRVALHLVVQPPDNRFTFYADIERLATAHSLTVTARGAVVQQQFWRIDDIDELYLSTDEDYADAFRAIFTEAVACRIPPMRPIGVLLSGGLDSTSVAAMLHRLLGAGHDPAVEPLLHTFSAYFSQTPECDERDYIDATLQLGGITPHFVDVESSSPLAELDEMLATFDEPFSSPTAYIPWQAYQAASQQGIGVVFDGIDGDTAVHHGDAYLAELARAGRWDDFSVLANAIAERKKLPLVDSLIYRYGEPYLKSLAADGHWFKLYQEVRGVAPYATKSARRLFYSYVRDNSLRPLLARAKLPGARWQSGRGSSPNLDVGVLNPLVVQQTDLLDHLHALELATKPPATSRQEHYQQLNSPLQPQIFEISRRIARKFGVEVRQPFSDRRLIEFCYALPPQQKIADGWTRNIVRRGLAGIIPDAIRLRGDKALNSRAFTKGFLGQDARVLERLLCQDIDQLAQFVDIPKLHAAFDRYRTTHNSKDEMLIWQSATLAGWLQRQKGVTSPT